MPDITKIDKNFAVEKKLNQEGINFYNPLLKPFEINGVKYDDGVFFRLPQAGAEKEQLAAPGDVFSGNDPFSRPLIQITNFISILCASTP